MKAMACKANLMTMGVEVGAMKETVKPLWLALLATGVVGSLAVPGAAVDVTAPVIEGCRQLPQDRCSGRGGLLSRSEEPGRPPRLSELGAVKGVMSAIGMGGFDIAAMEAPPKVEKAMYVPIKEKKPRNPNKPFRVANPQANTGDGGSGVQAEIDRDNGRIRIANAPQANTGDGDRSVQTQIDEDNGKVRIASFGR